MTARKPHCPFCDGETTHTTPFGNAACPSCQQEYAERQRRKESWAAADLYFEKEKVRTRWLAICDGERPIWEEDFANLRRLLR